jgi:hypothetical protein
MLIQKSKQDHFQKKAAVAAATAAFSGAGLINEKNIEFSDECLFDYKNSDENFSTKNVLISKDNFIEKKSQNENVLIEKNRDDNKMQQIIINKSNRKKLDDIPRWNHC